MPHLPVLFLVSVSIVLVSCAAQSETAGDQSNCHVLIKDQAGKIEYVEAPTIDLSDGENFEIPDNLIEASSIVCERSNLVVTASDFLVVSSSDRLVYLKSDTATIVLRLEGGQFRFVLLKGKLNEKQISRLQKSMKEAQLIIRGE